MSDSPRWCKICEKYGDHHSDQHFAFAAADETIAKYRAWSEAGKCYACGSDGTHIVSLPWMRPERIYCRKCATDWARAGYPQFVRPRETTSP